MREVTRPAGAIHPSVVRRADGTRFLSHGAPCAFDKPGDIKAHELLMVLKQIELKGLRYTQDAPSNLAPACFDTP